MTCPNCGEANPSRARFCVRCGLPLEDGRRRGVRKVVTVVVCDVTGSTALAERLDPESLGLVMARWFDAMQGSTFWPVAEVVRRAAEIKAADAPEQARAKLDELLAGADDGRQVAERVGRLIGLEASPVPAEDSAWAVRRCLEVVAAQRPLVVVIDDLHWAEPTLLDLLEQVVSLAGDAPLPSEAVGYLSRIGEGNPLFLEELLAMLVEEGRLRLDAGRWVADDLAAAGIPPTIQVVLAARLDRLAAEERAVLDRASVMGQVFDQPALLALSPPAARASLPDHLLSLVRKELLRPSEGPFGGRDGFQFRHLLVRDAAYGSLPRQTRAELHEGYAGWLAELGEALLLKLEPDRAAGVLDEALEAADRTGDAGLRAHATLGKLDLRLDTEPDRPDQGPAGFRAEVRQVLSALEALGDHQGQARGWRLLGLDSYLRCHIGAAEEEFQRALEHAELAGDERLEAGVAYALAQAAFWGPAPVADGIARCEDIRRRAEGSYRVEMAALHTLAGLHAMQGRFRQARELADASAAIAGKLGPNRFAAICSQFLGQTELLAGDLAAAEQRLRWGYGILERTGERGLRSELAANLARVLCAQGRDDEAMHLALLSGGLAFRDDLYAQVERRGPLATVLARRDRQQEAERVAAEAVAMARRSDMLTMQANALVDHAAVLRLGGHADRAAPLLAEAMALYGRKGNLVARDRAGDLLAGPLDG